MAHGPELSIRTITACSEVRFHGLTRFRAWHDVSAATPHAPSWQRLCSAPFTCRIDRCMHAQPPTQHARAPHALISPSFAPSACALCETRTTLTRVFAVQGISTGLQDATWSARPTRRSPLSVLASCRRVHGNTTKTRTSVCGKKLRWRAPRPALHAHFRACVRSVHAARAGGAAHFLLPFCVRTLSAFGGVGAHPLARATRPLKRR